MGHGVGCEAWAHVAFIYLIEVGDAQVGSQREGVHLGRGGCSVSIFI